MAVDTESRNPGSALLRSVIRREGQKDSILVVEDNAINRELLQELLQDEFHILTAENGAEGIRLLKANRETLCLVLLDVYMPVCNGFTFLAQTQKDPYLSSVPVIVTTGSDKPEDEERCLKLGATDFITKPYNPETMLGRIHNVIRLHETLSTLAIVEFDHTTGLYNMSAFQHHADQLLQESEDSWDLGILCVQDLASINRFYGAKMGDEVLVYLAQQLKALIPDAMLARMGDCFYLLRNTGRRETTCSLADRFDELTLAGPIPNLRIQLGLYHEVDRTQSAFVLCDRVRMTLLPSGQEQGGRIIYYDAAMEQKRLKEQKMLLAFEDALANREFVIWIQPKVSTATGRICAGEALVRWIDAEGHFISPGDFIPLFEQEGQIRQLDEYIFQTVCTYQQEQHRLGNRVVPISVNLSRNSLFRKGIVSRYRQIAEETQVDLSLVPIEITESAASSAALIRGICEEFVRAGFLLHMDDFGTGYSSFSALASLPFAVLKLDKSLVDQIGTGKGNTVLKNMVETAHELGMQVVAEGVEEASQVDYLTLIRCDQIQGYYYSAPKKTPDFEALLTLADPFPEKERLRKIHIDGVIRLSSSDLRRWLQVCRLIFASARILYDDLCTYSVSAKDGTLQPKQNPCYEIWERKERCSTCISGKAMCTRNTEHKFERFGDEVYSVYAIFLEVDGAPCVLELLGTVGRDPFNGVPNAATLLEILQHTELSPSDK